MSPKRKTKKKSTAKKRPKISKKKKSSKKSSKKKTSKKSKKKATKKTTKKKSSKKVKKKVVKKKKASKKVKKKAVKKKKAAKKKIKKKVAKKPAAPKVPKKVAAAQDRRSRAREKEAKKDQKASQDTTLDRTAMRIYLDQIEHIPLLTPAEEISLAREIQAGGKTADGAREKMIKSNLRLVISIAKRYANMGLSFSDLVEEGNMGLMRAVEKFDPERGYRFSTYSSWWIKQAMMRALSNQGKTIRIPVYMYDIISKWRKVRDGLTQRYGRIPTAKEVAKIMELPVRKIKEIEKIVNRPSSLNAPVSLEGSAELIDLIEDDNSKSPDISLGEMFQSERLKELLEVLDDRERRILLLRFGIDTQQTHTLEEIAGHFDITRERVRQIEVSALKKIRLHLQQQGEQFEDFAVN